MPDRFLAASAPDAGVWDERSATLLVPAGAGVPPTYASSPLRLGDRSLPRGLASQASSYSSSTQNSLAPGAQLTLPIFHAAAKYVSAKLEQANPVVYRKFLDESKRLSPHPALELWNNPNEDMNGKDLVKAVMLQALFFERAYILKYRVNGRIVALMPFKHDLVLPQRNEGSGRLVDYYKITTDVGDKFFPREDVIEVRFSVNPADPLWGLSSLDATGTSAFGLRTITEMTASLTSGMAMSSGVVIPKEPLNEDELIESRDALDDLRVNREKAGQLQIFNQDARIEQLGFEPAKLALNEQMVAEESHVLMSLRLHPSVIYSLAGLQYDNTRGGRQESRKESFTELIIPLWETLSDALTSQLLTEWPTLAQRGDFQWGFDYSHIDELVAGDSERFERWGLLFERGGCTLNELRTGVGLQRLDDADADRIPSPAERTGPNERAADDNDNA